MEHRRLVCGNAYSFQGDERDIMFLSLVAASNKRIGPLTKPADERRFNVAASRARDQMILFHSVTRDDLSASCLRRRVLEFFENTQPQQIAGIAREELEQRAFQDNRQVVKAPKPFESWFEVDVALELLRRKYRLQPQVEVAGYRLDLMVEGLGNRLAVECDGDFWHGPERYEQDMARQRQLVRAGWTFVRIRELEFYADRQGSIRRIEEACEGLGIRPIGEEVRDVDEESATSVPADEPRPQNQEVEKEHSKSEKEAPGRARKDRGSEPSAAYTEDIGFPDPRDAAPSQVRAALHRIIEDEGPLTKSFLMRLYVAGCPGLHRAGKSIRSLLNKALYAMQRAGEIVMEDELGDRSLESQVVRLAGTPKIRERPAGQRDLLEIPPSELFLVLDSLYGSSNDGMLSDETLFRDLLDHYGFSRLTEVRRRHLAKILRGYHRRWVPSKTGTAARAEHAVQPRDVANGSGHRR